jgi:hypothetical protein
MKPDLMAQLSRLQREALESAGYRVVRWEAARAVLLARVTKGRIAAPLGDFLAHWLSLAPAHDTGKELWLSFDHTPDQEKLQLSGGSTALAASPLEHALLHLPALRPFWRQELRQQHFEALLTLVPQAWLLDAAAVPPGAVIQGLNLTSWEHLQQGSGHDGQIQDRNCQIRKDWPDALADRDSIWVSRRTGSVEIKASYGRNAKDQVVLRSVEAAP